MSPNHREQYHLTSYNFVRLSFSELPKVCTVRNSIESPTITHQQMPIKLCDRGRV